MKTVLAYIPSDAEIGVGLAILNDRKDYLFFLAGTRHLMDSNEMFFAGIGGHLEPGESLSVCGRREAMEEIGATIEYISHSQETLYISTDRTYKKIEVSDEINPWRSLR